MKLRTVKLKVETFKWTKPYKEDENSQLSAHFPLQLTLINAFMHTHKYTSLHSHPPLDLYKYDIGKSKLKPGVYFQIIWGQRDFCEIGSIASECP